MAIRIKSENVCGISSQKTKELSNIWNRIDETIWLEEHTAAVKTLQTVT